jgi:hypothetical protein
MSKQKLNRSDVLRSLVDQCRLRPPHRVRAVSGRIESDCGGRVEMWRGSGRLGLSVAAPFVWRCPNTLALTPFPHPAHRTRRADLPQRALGQDITPSYTASYTTKALVDERDRSARRDAGLDRPRPCDV